MYYIWGVQEVYGEVNNKCLFSLRRNLLSSFKDEIYGTNDGNDLPGCVFLAIVA
jgi:hypothetical protein